MEVKKDEGGGLCSSSIACYRSTLIAALLFFLFIGVFVGLLIGESTENTVMIYHFSYWSGKLFFPKLVNHFFSVLTSVSSAGAALFHGDSGAARSEV